MRAGTEPKKGKMKIAIDCRKIGDGGIGVYLRNLLAAWEKQKIPAKLYLFHQTKDRELFCYPKDFAELISHDIPKYSMAELFSFSQPLKNIGADLFFTPHYTLPYNLLCPSVVTIHDLIHLKFPVKGGPLGNIYASQLLRHACKAAGAILTDSENTKRDIAAFFPRWAEKVKVIYPGVNPEIFRSYPPDEVEAFRKEKMLPERFVLYVGALKTHKNPQALVQIPDKLNFPVVIATQEHDSFRLGLINSVKQSDLIRFVSIENDLQMALLYNTATVLVHPAFYEGFGLPPLEAQACGLPVVCSNAASLPEVVGDAAMLFAPNDISSMLEMINLLWREPAQRNILGAKGVERSRSFEWERSATRIFEIFCKVAAVESSPNT
jgi:glycosyltransferase involved in cell wall biosynthesis